MKDDLFHINMALGMSHQSDGHALTKFLVEHGPLYLENAQVTVLEVYGHKQAHSLSAAASATQLTIRRFDDQVAPRPEKSDDSGIQLAIARQRPVVVETQAKQCRLIIPTHTTHGPMRLVVFDNIDDSPESRIRALQIAELYDNQIRLMDSRERDQLTGLLNRQTFSRYFRSSRQRNKNDSISMWLAIMDIDNFKRVNDTYGHLYGDEVLLHFARLMEQSFRFSDPLFRFGGEEFIVLLSSEHDKTPDTALQRFRHKVESYPFPGVGQVTVSIGCVECTPGELPTTVIDKADKALYHAKENGRNQLVHYREISVATEQADTAEDVDLF